jgi:cytochrome P450
MRVHMPPSDEWTEVNVNRVSGRIFVGPELCQDPEYLHCGSNYTLRVMDVVNAVKKMSPWLRPFLASRLPEVKNLRAMEQRAAQLLEPFVRQRMESEKNDPNWVKPEDMMQWVINRHAAEGVPISAEEMAKLQLGFVFAAVHTTTMTATNIIYTLATTPEYIQPLREEIRTVMADNDNTITSRALQQMVKLDSYMKEVTRLYPPGISKPSPTLFSYSYI